MIEGEPVYDTLCVHDTLYRHDTITLEDHLRNPAPANKIHPQTVTFLINPVFDSKQEKLSSVFLGAFRCFDQLYGNLGRILFWELSLS